MKEHKLPKPASCATDDELNNYANQFDPSGDRRVLAEEILRLRFILDKMSIQWQPGGEMARTTKPATSNDDALI